MNIPDRDELRRGFEQYELHEKRDSMYKTATFLVAHFWGQPADMADGLGVLLLTWNQAHYRYGPFDFDRLEQVITSDLPQIEVLRQRDIASLTTADGPVIRKIFVDFLDALRICEGNLRGRKTPVGVAKALHLLAPAFFPIWDDKIARAYDCYYEPHPDDKYVSFCRKIQMVVHKVGPYITRSDRTLVKLIDEYNYAKYTQGWI
jgi:hypothetical protein